MEVHMDLMTKVKKLNFLSKILKNLHGCSHGLSNQITKVPKYKVIFQRYQYQYHKLDLIDTNTNISIRVLDSLFPILVSKFEIH